MTMISLNQTMAILTRDLRLSIRSGGGWFHALLFFGLVAGLSGLLFGPELSTLSRAAPAVVWLAAALAVQFAVVDIFQGDLAEGFLHSVAAEEGNFLSYYIAKVLLVLVTVGAPLVLATPVVLGMYGVGGAEIGAAVALVLIGVPALISLAVFTSAVATGLRSGGMLAMAVAAPFLAPVLIFGALAVKAAWAGGVLWTPEALILAALTLALTGVMPWFTISALRAALE